MDVQDLKNSPKLRLEQSMRKKNYMRVFGTISTKNELYWLHLGRGMEFGAIW